LGMFAASHGVEVTPGEHLPGIQLEREQTEAEQRANARRIAEGV
jgi:hypothetical protein